MIFRRRQPSQDGLIAALDIGSTRVYCALARLREEGGMEIVGCSQHAAKGMRRGLIVDMEAMTSAVAHAVHGAEKQAGETIQKIYVGVPAGVIQSAFLELQLSISNRPVNESDLQALFSQAHDHFLGGGQEILHAIPLNYQLDDQKGIADPLGMYGARLVAHFHLLTVPQNILRNITACVNACHLDVAGFIAAPHASALAALVEDEMELGVTLIDFGGGSTSMISYINKQPVFFTSVPVGGAHITQDVARVLSTPLSQAERLKTLYGSAYSSSSDEREMLTVPQIGEEGGNIQISRSQLNRIILPRLEEVFSLLQKRFTSQGTLQGNTSLLGRVVLTGGACQLAGIREYTVSNLSKVVRVANVSHIPSAVPIAAGPSFATCAGILKYASRSEPPPKYASPTSRKNASGGLVERLFSWMKHV